MGEDTIAPVTRIEGHAKITVFAERRRRRRPRSFPRDPVQEASSASRRAARSYEMPSLMARICGICPVEPPDRVSEGL